MPGTRKLGRPTAHRNLMLRGMVTYLLENGKIKTTLTRAKEVRALTDKMITLGKEKSLASYRQALAFITKEDVAKKLFDSIAPSYEKRNGGYTAIYKLGPRRGDGADMALITLVEADKEEEVQAPAPKKAKKSTKKAAEAVEEVVEAPAAEEAAVEAPAEEAAAE